jgi:hypothetical protein
MWRRAERAISALEGIGSQRFLRRAGTTRIFSWIGSAGIVA